MFEAAKSKPCERLHSFDHDAKVTKKCVRGGTERGGGFDL